MYSLNMGRQLKGTPRVQVRGESLVVVLEATRHTEACLEKGIVHDGCSREASFEQQLGQGGKRSLELAINSQPIVRATHDSLESSCATAHAPRLDWADENVCATALYLPVGRSDA